MVRDGSAQPASPTILAGTPATVTLCGTGFTTTEPAAMRAQLRTSSGVYVDGLEANGAQSTHASQIANAYALSFGLVPPDQTTRR